MPAEQRYLGMDSHRNTFLDSVVLQEAGTDISPHMGYPRVWEFLGGPDPALLLDYLKWLHADEERFESAVQHMEWYEVGFHGLPLANAVDPYSKIMLSSIQANFYSEEFPGNEDPHAHSRNAKVVFYADPRSRQIDVQSMLLHQGAQPVNELPIRAVPIIINCLTTRDGGQSSSVYNPVVVGEGYVAQVITTMKAPLTEQIFNSIGVHNITYEGPGVAVSIHAKGPRESEALNNHGGLVYYKGLTHEQAEHVDAISPFRGSPRTLILPTRDFTPQSLRPTRLPAQKKVAEKLLHGALHTAEMLIKTL